jgi:hypothetical protein
MISVIAPYDSFAASDEFRMPRANHAQRTSKPSNIAIASVRHSSSP